MTATEKRRIFAMSLIVLLLFVTAFSSCISAPRIADAADAIEISTEIESSDVMSDLEQSGVDGIGFDIENYPAKASGEIRMIYAVEFGYSRVESLQKSFGIFIYIYNPAELNILAADVVNSVTMDVGDGSGYSSYSLRFVSRSKENRFYKFEVIDNSDAIGERIIDRVNPDARSYAFGEFEYITEGSSQMSSSVIGMRYIYSGFADGLGSTDDDNSLSCDYEAVRTIELHVKDLAYKAGFSGGDENFQANTDVHAVYFGIDNDILETYGDLVQIKFDYWQYMTPYIVVLNERDLYDRILKYSGLVVPASTIIGQEDPQDLRWEIYNNAESYGLAGGDVETVAGHNRMWFYLLNSAYVIGEKAILCPFTYYRENGSVSSDEILEDIRSYNKTAINGFITIGGVSYSADVLGDFPNGSALSWDIDLATGYSGEKIITVEDEFDLATYDYTWRDKTESWWWEWFYDVPVSDSTPEDITPIETLTTEKLDSSNASKDLLIDVNDIATVRDDVRTANADDQTVYIFRYTYTPYVTMKYPGFMGSDPGGFAASQGVIIDFDIIELGFEKDGILSILPVAMNPITTTGEVDPPAEDDVLQQKVADFFSDVGEKMQAFFGKIGDWFEANWKWVVIGISAVAVFIIVLIIIRLVPKNRAPRPQRAPAPPKAPKSTKRKG